MSIPFPSERRFYARDCGRPHDRPQFNQSALAGALEGEGISYLHAVELGGLRNREPGEELFECLGQFAGYAARMRSPDWQAALDEALARPKPCLMCAETPWQRCHRRLISELLVACGHEVVHLIGTGLEEQHQRHPAADIREGILYLCGEPVREVSSDPIR